MDNNAHERLKLPDRSYSSSIKKIVRKIAEQMGFTPYRLAEIDIIVAEILSNIIKHSVDGEILVKKIETVNQDKGIELLSIDRGPGMANTAAMLKDGISTTSTLGQGLGAIKRLSDDFDIYSLPSWGTILLSRVYLEKPHLLLERELLQVNTIMLPKPGQEECGDGWKIIKIRHKYKLIALDGLGHGPEAARAVQEAIKEFIANHKLTPSETIKAMHKKIRGTRGAVGMIFHLDYIGNSITFTGLGNISARIIGYQQIKNFISHNGIIGYSIPNTLKNNEVKWIQNECLIIHSDGLKSRWDLTHLPNILNYDGSIVAASLYKDFSRDNDDLLVIVLNKKIRK
jgi:anti-sigma regulatory factor (Ser/Thr protein kinase)